MSDDEENEREPERKPDWIPFAEVFRTYSINAQALRDLTRSRRVRTKNEPGTSKPLYSTEDLEKLDREEATANGLVDHSVSELIRAAKEMLQDFARTMKDGVVAAQSHEQGMFTRYTAALDKMHERYESHSSAQDAHILKLEKAALDMREATEKVFNLQHERDLDFAREERKKEIQKDALAMLGKTVLPIIAAKMPGGVPGMPKPAESGAPPVDERMSAIGQAVVSMVAEMSDEKFAALETVIPAAEFAVLCAIRDGVKAGA